MLANLSDQEFAPLSPNPIRVLVAAAPTESVVITNLLEETAPGKYEILATYQDLADESTINDILASRATLVVVHQSVAHFTVQMLHYLAYSRAESAKVIVAIVSPLGDVFDATLSSGAVPFRMPTRAEIFRQVDENYPELLAQASQRQAMAEDAPPVPPEPAPSKMPSYPGSVRQALQVLTAWSSKGGDGKSLLAMELGYILANIAGRRVLLVDADMNRGYIAPALGRETLACANERNITTLATLFHSRGQLPYLSDYVYSYPPAFGRGMSNLSILLGITSPEQSGLSCYTAENGNAGRGFIQALIQIARSEYEFVIFDIGTLIPVPVHAATIANASTLIVVTSPMVPAVQPTRLGMEQMRSYSILGEKGPVLVVNKWTEDCGLTKDDFATFLHIPTVATIPSVPLGQLQRIVNSGRFMMQAYLADPEKEAELTPLAVQLLALAEQFSPGTRAAAERNIPRLGKALAERRKGLFGIAVGGKKKGGWG